MRESITNLAQLLKVLKQIVEKDFTPEGCYYVDKLVRKGQTSLVIHLLFDSPNEPNHCPKVREP